MRHDVGMDSLDDSPPAALPIACTLGQDDGAARMQEREALSDTGRPSARRSGQIVLYVAADPSRPDDSHAS